MGNKKLGTIELIPKENFMIIKLNMIKLLKLNICCLLIFLKKIKEVESIALKAHKITGCKGITRSDFRY